MRRRALIIVGVLALAGAAYAVWRIQRARAPFEWPGTVEARTIEVGSRVGGRVASVDAREGDVVGPGAAIVKLESGDLPAQRLIAGGQLHQAEAALEKLSRSLPSARRAEIAAAEARLRAEETVAHKARLDADRLDRLYRSGAATRVDAEAAGLALRNADAQAAALRAQVDNLVRGTPQDVKAARGAVEAAQGRLAQIDEMLRELVIRSPHRARVESLDLRPGDILAPNATAARLLEPEQLYVRVYVPETQIGHVRPGMNVPIYVDSFPGRAFRGRVQSVAGEGEFTPRNLQTADERADQVFETRVDVQEGTDVLRAGMAAVIRVPR